MDVSCECMHKVVGYLLVQMNGSVQYISFTCFQCGSTKEEEISVYACRYVYKCAHCGIS